MIAIGALRMAPRSRTVRVFALAVGLVLTFVCQSGVPHAAGDQLDGCPQIKLEGQRLPAAFAEAVLTPVPLLLGEPPLLTRVVHPDDRVAALSLVSRRASPRAPPTA